MTDALSRRAAALTVPCSHCRAPIFKRCVIPATGAAKNAPHMDRLRLTAALTARPGAA